MGGSLSSFFVFAIIFCIPNEVSMTPYLTCMYAPQFFCFLVSIASCLRPRERLSLFFTQDFPPIYGQRDGPLFELDVGPQKEWSRVFSLLFVQNGQGVFFPSPFFLPPSLRLFFLPTPFIPPNSPPPFAIYHSHWSSHILLPLTFRYIPFSPLLSLPYLNKTTFDHEHHSTR